ncbi:MAG: hypothetical protein GF347_04220, partial [Candidatus Moranbacteria bacterium]|nr:hypothetical protein [Candidatus Moranbacteria bacterium]
MSDNQKINQTPIGPKAKTLFWFKKNKIKTPKFTIVNPTDYIPNYDEFLIKQNRLFQKKYFKTVQKNILKIKFKNDLETKVDNLKKRFDKPVCFRTSANKEDASKHSFAGLYDSFINIELNLKNFKFYFKKCLLSLFSKRVYLYLDKNKIEKNNLNLSIIIQEYFKGEYSGVAFANYPLNNS